MSVTLGSYTYGCGDFHQMPRVQAAPVRQRRVEVFGLDGVGEVYGGLRSRRVPIRCLYTAQTSGALANLIAADDATKQNRNLATLVVDNTFVTDVVFQGLEMEPMFFDGANSNWRAFGTLRFESYLN